MSTHFEIFDSEKKNKNVISHYLETTAIIRMAISTIKNYRMLHKFKHATFSRFKILGIQNNFFLSHKPIQTFQWYFSMKSKYSFSNTCITEIEIDDS